MVQNISSLHWYVNDFQSNVQSTTVLNTDISKYENGSQERIG